MVNEVVDRGSVDVTDGTGDTDHIVRDTRRKNILYRSIEKLRRTKNKADVDGVAKKQKQDQVFPDGKERSMSVPTATNTATSQNETRRQSAANGQSDEKGKKMTRPFSTLFQPTKKEEIKPPTQKPDHFKDVKLKKTVTEEKLTPKTTERYKLFEGVYQVSLLVDEDTGKLKPVVSWSHPPLGTTRLTQTEKIIADFAFPDLDLLESKRAKSITETYAFVQTTMSAERIIGYCRRFKYKINPANRTRSGTEASVTQSTKSSGQKLTKIQSKLINIRVWCIVTKIHCFDTFSAIFDKIHSIRRENDSNTDAEVFSLLKAIGENAAPLPDNTVTIQYVSKLHNDNKMGSFELKRPGPEDRIHLLRHAAGVFGHLPKDMLITIMIALLTESKLLFLGKTLSSLTSTLHALTSLLHPLTWEGIYIPILSVGVRSIVRDLVLSPSPYVIGMLKDDYGKVYEKELRETEVLVVDLTRKRLSDLRNQESMQLSFSEASRKALKAQLREIKKKGDQLKQCEVWGALVETFLKHVKDIATDDSSQYRQLLMSDYVNKVRSEMEGDEQFAEQLLSTQMSQMWLQKQRVKLSRNK